MYSATLGGQDRRRQRLVEDLTSNLAGKREREAKSKCNQEIFRPADLAWDPGREVQGLRGPAGLVGTRVVRLAGPEGTLAWQRPGS